MIDIRLVREKPEVVRKSLEKRGEYEKLKVLDELIELDAEWRRLTSEVEKLRYRRNVLTQKIASLRKRGEKVDDLLNEAKALPAKIKGLEEKVREYKGRIRRLLLEIPNIIHESVPIGKDESENVTVRVWGSKPEFEFPVRDHTEIALNLGIVELERAAKIAGSRFFYLKGKGVLLELALIRLALDHLVSKGWEPIEPPYMMRREPYEGVTDLGDFEEMLYKVEGEDLYLIATSEHPLAAMFMNEVLYESDLPLRFVGVSPCFRKEAGAHGKDTKGIFRTHQFNKVEQFVFCKPEDSWRIHEELIRNAEEIYRKLELPYRVVNVCSGELGAVAAKKYDLEVWMPAQRRYREVVSCSNCTDYQARSLNIKYREGEGKPPKGFVHTLNSTALATGRTIVAILENYQERDGSVIVPKALRPYMGGLEVIRKGDP
ncbi:serine--tRNA ligase [Candidatus Bathyarchaeota archaeon B24-2]|nr:MAG: serine--tRNA ligase [Candidatus Bathyarchaeota archaeon B24-2]